MVLAAPVVPEKEEGEVEVDSRRRRNSAHGGHSHLDGRAWHWDSRIRSYWRLRRQ
jgi:hypothetical protein